MSAWNEEKMGKTVKKSPQGEDLGSFVWQPSSQTMPVCETHTLSFFFADCDDDDGEDDDHNPDDHDHLYDQNW